MPALGKHLDKDERCVETGEEVPELETHRVQRWSQGGTVLLRPWSLLYSRLENRKCRKYDSTLRGFSQQSLSPVICQSLILTPRGSIGAKDLAADW